MPKIKKVLIANRGEIALRIIRACRDMGIRTVAVYSTADKNAMHVQLADESVCIGPAPARDSYLNESAILTAALLTNSDAIHPGYGFLSERADFAQKVQQHGMIWIGPEPDMIEKMGDKVNAKKTAIKCGLPVVPGSDGAVKSLDDALKWAEKIGYPVMLKAAAGGGGRGMRAVMDASQMAEAFNITKQEAKSGFGDDTLYMEKLLLHPRHIEFQVLGDKHGNVVIFGERDCSLQRKNQKVMEECPAAALTQKQRDDMIEICKNAAKKMKYSNVGTFEFMFQDGRFYFLEMNTRLQVEHPVTEMVYGVDLVREQIRVAAGEKLGYTQSNVIPHGHAIEFRINAEDPEDLYVKFKKGNRSNRDQIMVVKKDFRDKGADVPEWALPSMTVGTKKPNAWGIYDMLGNGSEFVLDTVVVSEARDKEDGKENRTLNQICVYEKEETDPLRIAENTKSKANGSIYALLRGSTDWHQVHDAKWFWKSRVRISSHFKALTFRLVIGPDLLKERGIKQPNPGK